MERNELQDFSPPTVFRAKTRLRRQRDNTKTSVGLKHFQLDWLLGYIESLELTAKRIEDMAYREDLNSHQKWLGILAIIEASKPEEGR